MGRFSPGDAPRATLVGCLFFAGFGCLIPFLPLWLEQAQGFSGSEIGLVLALGGFSRVVAGPLTAAWADGQPDRRAPLFLFAAVLITAFAALWFVTGFAAVFALVLVMDIAFWGLVPLIEAMLYRLTRHGRPGHGLARGLASAAFVAGSSSVGALVTGFGPWAVWAWLLGVSALLMVSVLLLPREPVTGVREAPFMARLVAGLSMLRDRRFALLIFAAGLIQASHGYFYVAGTLIWTGDQQLSATMAGSLWSAGVLAEVAFLVLLGGWSLRFAPETLVVAGGLVAVLRWSCMAALPPLWALWPLQLLHAGTFAFTFLGCVRLIHALQGEDRAPTAQIIYMAMASAPLQALATFVSGTVYERLQPGGEAALGYLTMSLVALLGLGLAVRLWLNRQPA